MRSLGLVGACAGLAAFAGLGRLCALAGGRFCWACGRVWAAVGGRLWVGACWRCCLGLLALVGAWVGAFAGLSTCGWALLLACSCWACGRYCWDCGAGLWALLLACGRLLALAGALGRFCGDLLGLLALLGLVLVGAFAVWALLWALLLGLWRWVFVGAFAGLVGACGLSWGCGRFRWTFAGGLWALVGSLGVAGARWAWALLLGLRALARSCWWTMPQRSQLLQDDEGSSGRSQT